MAVQGTSERVQGELREGGQFTTSMDSSTYAGAVGGAQSVTGTGQTNWLGTYKPDTEATAAAGSAGIKYQFQTKMDNAIAEYESGINGEIDKMATNCEGIIAKAFRGTNIESAVNKLIEALRAEAKAYNLALKNAESQIVEQVAKAYAAQDVALGDSMNADTATMTTQSAPTP